MAKLKIYTVHQTLAYLLGGDFCIIAFVPLIHKFKWENLSGILNRNQKTLRKHLFDKCHGII